MFSSPEDRPKIIGFSIGLCTLFLAGFLFVQHGFLAQLLVWFSSLGVLGFVLFIGLYVCLSFPVPMGTTPLGLVAGFLYGLNIGFVLVMMGSFLGASLSFIVCRQYLPDWVEERLGSKKQMLRAVTKAINKQAFKICFMTRMTPIPFGIQNAIFALSKLDFQTYITASILGVSAENLLTVYFGSSTKHLSDIIGGSDSHENESNFDRALVWGQVFLCIALLFVLVRIARKAFAEALEEEKREEDTPSRPLVEVPVDA